MHEYFRLFSKVETVISFFLPFFHSNDFMIIIVNDFINTIIIIVVVNSTHSLCTVLYEQFIFITEPIIMTQKESGQGTSQTINPKS